MVNISLGGCVPKYASQSLIMFISVVPNNFIIKRFYYLVEVCVCYEHQILAQLQTDITINTVPRATDDEIAALPVVRITQVEIGMSTAA